MGRSPKKPSEGRRPESATSATSVASAKWDACNRPNRPNVIDEFAILLISSSSECECESQRRVRASHNSLVTFLGSEFESPVTH